MALQLSQTFQSSRLCMPLAKFSYAVVPSGTTAPIPWTHISSQNDLFVTLEPREVSSQHDSNERNYRLRVLQDPNAHEDIDLLWFAHEARRAFDQAKNALPPGQQPFITVIVKTPCVAIRYPSQGTQVRRFQVRFAKEEDFYEILKTFSSMRIPFIEAGSTPRDQQLATSLNIGSASSGALVHSGAQQESISVQPLSVSQMSGPPPGKPAFKSMIYAGRNSNIATKPLSQPFFQTPFSASQHNPEPTAQPFTNSTIFQAGLETLDSGETSHTSVRTVPSISTYIQRPSTAPEITTTPLKIDLPPKRQLPFERKTRAIVSKYATKAAKDPPPGLNEMPMVVDDSFGALTSQDQTVEDQDNTKDAGSKAAKPKKKTSTRKPRTNAPRKKGVQKETQETTQFFDAAKCPEHSINEHTDRFNAYPEIDTQALLDHAEAIQAARKSNQLTTLTQPATSTEQDKSIQLHQQAQITQERVVAPSPELNSHHSALAALLSDPNFAPSAIQLPNSNASAVDFDSLPEQQRHAVLESWIIQNLEDDAFLRLCKTLEGVWQRIFVKI